MSNLKLKEELNKIQPQIHKDDLAKIEPFRMIIDGRSNCGKTRLLVKLLKHFQENETFEQIIIICPTFKRNKTYQNEDFIFKDKNILVCDCDFENVETYIKISRCYITSKPNIENCLIVFDDVICSEDILRRTSEITKLSMSGRHENISFILISQDFHTVSKKIRENCSKFVFFYNANKKQMETIFDKYLGYEEKEERNRIVHYLRNNKFSYLFINNESPYNHFVEGES